MKRLWKHKWLIVASAIVLVLVLGTVAWATTGGSGTPTAVNSIVTTVTGSTATTTVAGQSTSLRERIKQRIEKIRARDQALVKAARAKMTPADQATLDQLTVKAQDQQAVLKQARQDLGQTLKDIRALVGKYQPAGGSGTPSSTSTTTVTTTAQ